MKKGLLLALLFVAPLFAETETVGPFGPLNNTDNPFIISANQAQDLLNVEVTEGNKSVKKRRGYGTAFTLTIATSPVHGVYNFYDSNGSDVGLFFNDRRMNVSISGQSPSVFFSTGTNGATYQCVDSAGFAYCANTSRDAIIKVNSSTYTLLSGFTSTGTMVTVTPERLVQAGFPTTTSLVWFSKANDFTTWTVGGNPVDPIQFTITSPGSGIKHITYAHGRVYWFKDASFGYILEGVTQSDWRVVTVNSFLGTLHNTSIFRDDILYFQGNDGHFYAYDGSNLVKLSRDIQTTISQTQGRTSNSWTQSTQSEFEAGVSSADLSTSLIPGSILAKTTTYANNLVQQFSYSGSSQYVDTTTVSGAIQTMWPDEFNAMRDGTSNTARVWTISPVLSAQVAGGTLTMRPTDASGRYLVSIASSHMFGVGTTYYVQISSLTGLTSQVALMALNTSYFTSSVDQYTGNGQGGAGNFWSITFQLQNDNSPYVRIQDFQNRTDGSFTPPSNYYPFPVDVSLYLTGSSYRLTINTVTVSGSHTFPNAPLYTYFQPYGATNSAFNISRYSVTPQTFTVTTNSMDTGIVLPKWSTFTVTSTGYDGSTVTHTSQSSSDGTSFDSAVTLTNGTAIQSSPKRYVKINSLFSNQVATNAVVSVQPPYNVPAGSSGTFLSQVKNADNLSSWDSFVANVVQNDGRITFYSRGRSGVFTALASTPAWVQVSNGGIPTTSTGAYFQVRADFVENSSNTLRLDDFAQSWFEGAASDKTYATYHDNANWWSVASGTGATSNNKILRFDLLNPGWYVYDIGTGGMYVRSQSLYFGSVSAGKVYKYGDVDNDDGVAINSYWKSKDFFGASPFLDKDYQRLSSVQKMVANSTMTLTYTLDGASSTSFDVALGVSTSTFIQKNVNLPQGKQGRTISLKLGNNAADQPWEVFGAGIDYNAKSWSPK